MSPIPESGARPTQPPRTRPTAPAGSSTGAEETTQTHTCRLLDLELNDAGTALVCPHGYAVAIPGEITINGQTLQAGKPTPAGRVPVDPSPTARKVTGL